MIDDLTIDRAISGSRHCAIIGPLNQFNDTLIQE
jgi:hypothetical protein